MFRLLAVLWLLVACTTLTRTEQESAEQALCREACAERIKGLLFVVTRAECRYEQWLLDDGRFYMIPMCDCECEVVGF